MAKIGVARQSKTPVIRPAEANDRDTLVTIAKRTIRAAYPPFLGEDKVENWIASGEVETYFRANLKHCLVLLEDDRIRGFAADKDDLVDLVMIDRDHRRRGFGSALLADLERRMFRTRATLKLESFADNRAATGFYVAQGWIAGATFVDPKTGIVMTPFEKSA